MVELPGLEIAVLVLVDTLKKLQKALDDNGLNLFEELAGLQCLTGNI